MLHLLVAAWQPRAWRRAARQTHRHPRAQRALASAQTNCSRQEFAEARALHGQPRTWRSTTGGASTRPATHRRNQRAEHARIGAGASPHREVAQSRRARARKLLDAQSSRIQHRAHCGPPMRPIARPQHGSAKRDRAAPIPDGLGMVDSTQRSASNVRERMATPKIQCGSWLELERSSQGHLYPLLVVFHSECHSALCRVCVQARQLAFAAHVCVSRSTSAHAQTASCSRFSDDVAVLIASERPRT